MMVLLFIYFTQVSSFCTNDKNYECKDMGITKCLPKTERCSTSICDKPLPIEKPPCRKQCLPSQFWCEERGKCIGNDEVCDCGVDKIYCRKETYSCESRAGILDSRIFNVCSDGSCRGNCKQTNEDSCQDGHFKCGDECLAFSEIAKFRSCKGECILANQTCYKNNDRVIGLIIEKLSLKYHYIWIYIAGSVILSCFLSPLLCLLKKSQKSMENGEMKIAPKTPSKLENILKMRNKQLRNHIEPKCLQIFMNAMTTTLYIIDCYLHIPVFKYYCDQYTNKAASAWFFFLSVSTFILTIFFIQLFIWYHFFNKPTIKKFLVILIACLISPVIWISSPVLFLFVLISQVFSLKAETDRQESMFHRFKLFVSGNSIIITLCQGLPQLGLSFVYLVLYGIKGNWLLVVSCITGFGYQMLFFEVHMCLIFKRQKQSKEKRNTGKELEESVPMNIKSTECTDASFKPSQNTIVPSLKQTGQDIRRNIPSRDTQVHPNFKRMNKVEKLREALEKNTNSTIIDHINYDISPYSRQNQPNNSKLDDTKKDKSDYSTQNQTATSRLDNTNYGISHYSTQNQPTNHSARSRTYASHYKPTPAKLNAGISDQKQYLSARQIPRNRDEPYFN